MGRALEVIVGRVTNSTSLTTVTPGTGDSFAVRSFPFESGAYIAGIWAEAATAGALRVRSPRLHDNVEGLRFRNLTNHVRNYLPRGLWQRLYPQDSLTVQTQSGGADTTTAALLLYYNDLPGTDARLATWGEIGPRIVNLVTVEVDFTGPSTAGDWSAGDTLNSDFDLLKANVDYAVLGYEIDTQVAAFAIRGPDTGNLRVGGPGPAEKIETREWFKRLSMDCEVPAIPIINAANKGATLVFAADSTASASLQSVLHLAELSTR